MNKLEQLALLESNGSLNLNSDEIFRIFWTTENMIPELLEILYFQIAYKHKSITIGLLTFILDNCHPTQSVLEHISTINSAFIRARFYGHYEYDYRINEFRRRK